MVFDGSYKYNLDENKGAVAWKIHCKDTYRYSWGYLPHNKTSGKCIQIINYRPKLNVRKFKSVC